MYFLCTSFKRPTLQTTIFNFHYFILIGVLSFNRNVVQNYDSFSCGVMSTHYNYVCILVLTTLKKTT